MATAKKDKELTRVMAHGVWTVKLATGFETNDNGDSWEAEDATRLVYVSTLELDGLEAFARGQAALADLTKTAPQAFEEEGRKGQYAVESQGGKVSLFGFMAASKSAALCTITTTDANKDWAVSTFQTLKPLPPKKA